MTLAISGTTGITLATQFDSASTFGYRNRIINGGMVIDQRNAGASVTATVSGGTYVVDRWDYIATQASKFTIQQNAGAVTPPVGFINYLGITSSSAYSVISSDYFAINQQIEGLNVSDLGFGTASAKSVTLSFQVYSSLTGTFGGSLSNSAFNRSYPFTYSISTANTWTSISVTIAGDTSGTWLTTNGIGIRVYFGLGNGSTYSGTAGSWSANGYTSATGAVSVVGTSSATFYITGVQLEKGSTATSFDFRSYGTELQLCQRYYEKSYSSSQLPGASSVLAGAFGAAVAAVLASTAGECGRGFRLGFAAQKRTAPTMVLYDYSGTANAVRVYPTDNMRSGVTALNQVTDSGSSLNISFDATSAQAITAASFIAFNWTASAEL